MKCPSCDHEAPQEDFGSPLRCPDCGAFYEKALEFKLRRELQRVQPPPGSTATIKKAAQKVDEVLRVATFQKAPTEAQRRGVFGKFYCQTCGQVSNGRRDVPGSILIEIVLWLCFLVPGLCYSLWRHSAARQVCPACHKPDLIPVSSPKARQALNLP